MKKQQFVSLALGSAFAAVTLSPLAQAADSPFSTQKLEAGYQLAAADKKSDGKCGEAKCGADKKKTEAKCGADKKSDAKCGADKKAAEAKCGGDKKKDAACGGNK
ncbi:MAG: hypothetical protein PHT48_00520 [Dechloromonas sp.]|nr:hypothetical protein [Dechloromonas sp.]